MLVIAIVGYRLNLEKVSCAAARYKFIRHIQVALRTRKYQNLVFFVISSGRDIPGKHCW